MLLRLLFRAPTNGAVTSMPSRIPPLALLVVIAIGAGSLGASPRTAPAPVVRSVTPDSGPIGGMTQVAIHGTGFFCGQTGTHPAPTVVFGTASAVFPAPNTQTWFVPDVQSDTLVVVTLPAVTVASIVGVTVRTHVCGTSQPVPFTYLQGCSRSLAVCTINVDGAVSTGPARLRAQGFLRGFSNTPINMPMLNALKPQHWRLSDQPAHTYQVIAALPVAVTYVLSDGWFDVTAVNQHAAAPWADGFEQYDAYVNHMATGVPYCYPRGGCVDPPQGRVDQWDVQNEPMSNYLTPGSEGTPKQWLQMYAHAYQGITSRIANARLIGPSIPTFYDYHLAGGDTCCIPFPGGEPNGADFLDLATFLDFSAKNQLNWAAITWDEIDNSGPCSGVYCPVYSLESPIYLADHVARARRLLDRYPTLGHPEIQVNEFATPQNRHEPGWDVGWIAGVERSDADAAIRSCGMGIDAAGTFDECAEGVGGLFGRDNSTPSALYWVHRFYADMVGTRVGSSSAQTDLYSFATRDDGSATMRVLVGRAKSCRYTTCPDGKPALVPPREVKVQVAYPYPASYGSTGGVMTTVQVIPNQVGTVSAPTAVSVGRMPLVGGVVTVSIPSFADGEAYTIVLS
jgi:hypothetical protein